MIKYVHTCLQQAIKSITKSNSRTHDNTSCDFQIFLGGSLHTSCTQDCGGWKPWDQEINVLLIDYVRLFHICIVPPSFPSALSSLMPCPLVDRFFLITFCLYLYFRSFFLLTLFYFSCQNLNHLTSFIDEIILAHCAFSVPLKRYSTIMQVYFWTLCSVALAHVFVFMPTLF